MTPAHNRPTRGRKPHSDARAGFTLIELVTVIIVLGILAAVVGTRGFNLNNALSARQSEVRAQLRYLQLLAMKNGVSTYLGLRCNGSNYWAFTGTTPDTPSTYLALPGETAISVPLTSKSMTMSSFIISFDRNGIPYTGNPAVKLAASTSITITAGGGSGTLTVAPETGFVP